MTRFLKLFIVTVVLGAAGLWLMADTPPAKPKFANYTEKIAGPEDTSVEFEMIAIPGGTFMMGSPNSEKGRKPDEGPQHPVAVKPFWMAKYEVAWEEYDLFQEEMGVESPEENDKRLKENADAVTGPTPPYVDKNYGHKHGGHPALCMTHHAAMEFCRWLSKKTGKTYRLPTEAEWEYAARAGSKSAYFFGDDPSKLDEYAWYKKNSATEVKINGTTHKVGSKKPNPFGLHDMYGNVMEWCIDHYEKDYYSKFPADKPTFSPVLLPTAKRWSHVARGGSWSDDADALRSAARRPSDPSWMQHDPQEPKSIWWLTKFDVIGFRVVRALDEQENLRGLRSKVTRESE